MQQSSSHFYTRDTWRWPIWAETCSKDNTCLNKGHADIVAYKGVFIYFLLSNTLYNLRHWWCREINHKQTNCGAVTLCGLRSTQSSQQVTPKRRTSQKIATLIHRPSNLKYNSIFIIFTFQNDVNMWPYFTAWFTPNLCTWSQCTAGGWAYRYLLSGLLGDHTHQSPNTILGRPMKLSYVLSPPILSLNLAFISDYWTSH
jgi:hypothetical protein